MTPTKESWETCTLQASFPSLLGPFIPNWPKTSSFSYSSQGLLNLSIFYIYNPLVQICPKKYTTDSKYCLLFEIWITLIKYSNYLLFCVHWSAPLLRISRNGSRLDAYEQIFHYYSSDNEKVCYMHNKILFSNK